MTFTMLYWLLVSLRVWWIFSSSKSTNSTSTLLGSRRAASSRWLGWICQTRTRTPAGQCQVQGILYDVNRAVWLCSGAGWTIHCTSTNCIRGSARAGTHDVVRRTSYDVVRRRTQCERRVQSYLRLSRVAGFSGSALAAINKLLYARPG